MIYKFNLTQQFISGLVSFLTAVVVTQIFDNEIKWALALAIGIGTFITSGFHMRS